MFSSSFCCRAHSKIDQSKWNANRNCFIGVFYIGSGRVVGGQTFHNFIPFNGISKMLKIVIPFVRNIPDMITQFLHMSNYYTGNNCDQLPHPTYQHQNVLQCRIGFGGI